MRTAAEVVAADLDAIVDRAGPALSRLSGRRLLITGGAGFLGYGMVRAVLAHNDRRGAAPIDCTVYDNFARGVPGWLRRLGEQPNLHLVRHDVTMPLPTDAGAFDYIVHAAGIASPIVYRQRPIETMDANVGGLRTVLDHALRQQDTAPLRGLLYLSSSEIYGDPPPDAIPTPETYRGNVSCTGPRACYDESKRFGETLCVTYARHHGLPVTIVRPFNNYGPGLRITDGRVVPDLVRDALAGRDLVLHSDGRPTRTFCYITDAVAGYLRALTLGEPGEAYNIGADAPEISMAELADTIADLTRALCGTPGQVVTRPSDDADYLVDNPHRRRPDIATARRMLGFEPAVGLREGLRRSLLWYRDHPDAKEP